MKHKGILLLTGFLVVTLFSLSYAQSEQITKGLNFLFSTQNPDGSWNGTLHRGPFPATINVIETLAILGQGNTVAYSNAVTWLQAQELETTEQLSERIYVLSVAGTDKDLVVSYIENSTGAWGGHEDCEINNLDTALVIRALKKINFQDQNMLYAALDYLISTQNTDGGWGQKKGDKSEGKITAKMIIGLWPFKDAYDLQDTLRKANDYILSLKNPDGSFNAKRPL